MSQSLPARPHLPYYRKQAKALLKCLQSGDAEACARLSRVLTRLANATPAEVQSAGLTLSDAQWAIAREHGFESWPKFKQHIEALTVSRPTRHRPFVTELSYYDDRAKGLMSVHRAGLRSACRIVQEWHPQYATATDEQARMAVLSLDDARLIFAREHGFEDWPSFAEHIGRLARGEVQEPFQEAFEAIKAGDAERLRPILTAHPELATAYGTNGNTLLSLASSFFVKPDYSRPPALDEAQQSPAMQVVRLLLEFGADPDQANNRGWTLLHGAAYSNNLPLLEVMLERGASVEASGHGDGGTPLVQALFWGHTEAAERLAQVRVVPANLRVAAGLGDLPLIRKLVAPDRSLAPEAGARREFYRPHSGFPVWWIKDDARQILDEAIAYASRNGRTEAVRLLVERGADINGEAYFGTPLHWAAWKGHAETVGWLIAHGADVNRRAGFGAEPSLTALHVAAWTGQTEAARLLVEAGADPTVADRNYQSPPWGWAGHFGNAETREVILEAAAEQELFAAVCQGSLERAAALLERDPEAVNRQRYWATPLSQAAANGRLDLVDLLLEHGADPNKRDSGSGETALSRAREAGNGEIVERLLAGVGKSEDPAE